MNTVLYLLAAFIFVIILCPVAFWLGYLSIPSRVRAFKVNAQGELVIVCGECCVKTVQSLKSFGDPLIRILLYTDGSIDLRGNKRDIERLRKIVYEYHVLNVRYLKDYQSPMRTGHYSRVEPWETWPAAGERFLEAVCLALQDPACHKPSDWIFVPPRQRDRIAS